MAFSHTHQTGSDWKTICENCISDLPNEALGDLAFIYIHHQLAIETDRIIDYLRSHTGISHWVGSVAEALCSTGRESYEEIAIAILVTDFKQDDFRVISALRDNPQVWLDENRSWIDQHFASIAVVHGDPSHQRVPQTIEQLADQLQGFVVGGLTSSDTLNVQIANQAAGAGLSGVLLGSNIAMHTRLAQGCQLMSEPHTITECEQHIIVKIDDRPALDVFKEAIGPELAENLHAVGGRIFAALPIEGSDTGDYLVRNLVGLDPDHKLIAIGDIAHVGQRIQFARRDKDAAKQDLIEMVDQLKANTDKPIKGALYHTCLGRGRHEFGAPNVELNIIKEHLGDVPLIGFFANGEISHRRLYGYTGVLSVFY